MFPYREGKQFTLYMPSTPGRYEIKVFWACDSEKKFPLKVVFYTGKMTGKLPQRNIGQNVALKLSARYKNSGRTIITDNFVTTLDLTKK